MAHNSQSALIHVSRRDDGERFWLTGVKPHCDRLYPILGHKFRERREGRAHDHEIEGTKYHPFYPVCSRVSCDVIHDTIRYPQLVSHCDDHDYMEERKETHK